MYCGRFWPFISILHSLGRLHIQDSLPGVPGLPSWGSWSFYAFFNMLAITRFLSFMLKKTYQSANEWRYYRNTVQSIPVFIYVNHYFISSKVLATQFNTSVANHWGNKTVFRFAFRDLGSSCWSAASLRWNFVSMLIINRSASVPKTWQ